MSQNELAPAVVAEAPCRATPCDGARKNHSTNVAEEASRIRELTLANIAKIPAELRSKPQWIAFKLALRDDGKFGKPPADPYNGRNVSPLDPIHWMRFERAVSALRENVPGNLAGAGIVLTKDSGLVGVDLDGCIGSDGSPSPWAKEIIDRVPGYVEISPSGKGLRLFARGGPLPDGSGGRKVGQVEVYVANHFLTVTGCVFQGRGKLEAVDEATLRWMWDRFIAPRGPAPAASAAVLAQPTAPRPTGGEAALSDAEVLRLAAASDKFKDLWEGRWQGYFDSQSSADQSLLNTLARHTQDREQLRRLFLASGLGQRDKAKRLDYQDLTIDKALAGPAPGPEDPRPVVILKPGGMHHATDAALEILRQQPDLFETGSGMVRVVGSRIIPMTRDYLRDRLARVAAFTRGGKPADPPYDLVGAIMSRAGEWGLRPLNAVVTAPTMTPDGRVLGTSGYDFETGLLLVGNDWPTIPAAPTGGEAKAAFERLWTPFRKFPFAEEADRSVCLAAILTAAVRPCLRTAPAFGFDSPTAGSGKTLLARCLGILSTGGEPDLSPPFSDEAEARKRITAFLAHGGGCIIIDNVLAVLDSAVLMAVWSSGEHTDRLLGESRAVRLVNRALWTVTGNNLRVSRDLNRRILVCRIDPRMESNLVYRRKFDFSPDDYCRRNRLAMILDALIILRAFITARRPCLAEGRLASFEDWHDLVAQAVTWCGREGIAPVGNPLAVLKRQEAVDPDAEKTAALLEAWDAAFGSTERTVADVIGHALTDEMLQNALVPIAGERGKSINPRLLGAWLSSHAGKIIDGRCFVRVAKIHHGAAVWQISSMGVDGGSMGDRLP